MVFTAAGPAEIVRLAQKDEYFLTKLRSEMTDLIQKTKGVRWWMNWHAELGVLTDIAYFAVTTLLGKPRKKSKSRNSLTVWKNDGRLDPFLIMVVL